MSDAIKMKRLAVLLGVLWLLPALAGAQGMMGGRGMMDGRGMMGGGMMNGNGATNGRQATNATSPRHTYFTSHGVPANYAKMMNPLPAKAKNIEAGKARYAQMCASCHGPSGRGAGAGGMGMNPPPSDLASIVRMSMASDGYLYWSIAEGGAQFGTSMPAMKDGWKPAEIWQVILYLRTL